jgi:acetyltransferase-like isoleucine patch superfamily enzyme
MHPENIRLGKRVAFSFAVSGGVYVQANNGVVFGDDVIFGPGVKIVSANHDPENLDNYISAPPIEIGDRCWIGANAVILPGVTLGRRVTVGAGAVVTKSFPDDVVVIGNPARIIRDLKTGDLPDEALSQFLKISTEERYA